MRAMILLTLLSGCASVPVNIRNHSGLKQENINQTYMQAQRIFVATTKCTPPKNKNVGVQDTTVIDLNKGRNIFIPGGVAFIIGLYSPEDEMIFLSAEHPDRTRILFHEFLHFMFEQSPDCEWAVEKLAVQHSVIENLMEPAYFKETRRLKSIGDDWLLDVLRAYGLTLRKE